MGVNFPIIPYFATRPRRVRPLPDEIPLDLVPPVQPLNQEQEIELAPLDNTAVTAQPDATRQEYLNLYNAGVPRPTPTRHRLNEGGLSFRARHGGRGAMLGAKAGERFGLGGQIGGALAGGIASLIKPEVADNLEFDLITDPRWERDNAIAQQEAARKADVAKEYAQLYGVSLQEPNRPTLAASKAADANEIKRLQAEIAGERAKSYGQNIQSQIDTRKRTLENKTTDHQGPVDGLG